MTKTMYHLILVVVLSCLAACDSRTSLDEERDLMKQVALNDIEKIIASNYVLMENEFEMHSLMDDSRVSHYSEIVDRIQFVVDDVYPDGILIIRWTDGDSDEVDFGMEYNFSDVRSVGLKEGVYLDKEPTHIDKSADN